MYAHFNVRLLRKVRTVDYLSEYFAWDLEDESHEVESDAEVLEVENEVSKESENSEDS